MFRSINEKPDEGQLVMCKCPEWNREGFQIGTYSLGRFTYSGQSSGHFHNHVIGWTPLDEEGEQIDHPLAKKWRLLDAKIGAAYGREDENGDYIENEFCDLSDIGEIAALSLGYI